MDSIGYRKSIVASQLFAGLGLIGLAVLPNIISPYVGILIGVFFYALGSGLVEVLCSPIVEACPFDPVSYTHLDVYKRQRHRSAGRTGWN